MTAAFNPSSRLIFVSVKIDGPLRNTAGRFVLDTGSTRTLVNRPILESLGYDPDTSTRRFRVTTVSGVELAPSVVLNRLAALGHEQVDLPVVCHSLPKRADFDGLLGLDFFRGFELRIDFRNGTIELI